MLQMPPPAVSGLDSPPTPEPVPAAVWHRVSPAGPGHRGRRGAEWAFPVPPVAPGPLKAALQAAEPPALPSASDLTRWLGDALDHVGRGMLLVRTDARVLHANRLASRALGPGAVLQVIDGCLRAAAAGDQQALMDALVAATERGLRQMLPLGQGADALSVAVLPLDRQGAGVALVSLPQARGGGPDLAVHGFARLHGITSAETAVLEALLSGRRPGDIAREKGVQLSTVRTQIGQLRQKCGARTIRELLDRVAALPPMLALLE